MAVSRRLRYEILRRDNHACTYCGATAPDVKLTVDHVVPVALGGSDEPSNLTTACANCNGGKSASSPDAPVVAGVAQDALRWSQAMKVAAEQQRENLQALTHYQQSVYAMWDGLEQYLPTDWESSAERWFSMGLALEQVDYAMRTAFNASHVKQWDMWKYACGVIYKRLREQQNIAAELVADEDSVAWVSSSASFAEITPSWWSVTEEQSNAWWDLVARFPDLREWIDVEVVDVIKAASRALPDVDPTSVWYGFGDFKQQFGEGIKHRWVREALRYGLSNAEESSGYQYLVTMVYDYWAMATNGA